MDESGFNDFSSNGCNLSQLKYKLNEIKEMHDVKG